MNEGQKRFVKTSIVNTSCDAVQKFILHVSAFFHKKGKGI